MAFFHLGSILLDLPLTWDEKMTIILILFSAGLLCMVCAILLAIYLLKSDRFTNKSKPEKESLSFPSYEALEEESRLSRLKSKIGRLFRRNERTFKRSNEELEIPKDESSKTAENVIYIPPEEDSEPTDND